jgi:hypothetical protein
LTPSLGNHPRRLPVPLYIGGTHIEISPGEIDAWHPLIALSGDGRTPVALLTVWLTDRVHGWEVAWLAAHGILAPDNQIHGDLHDAIMTWTTTRLPAPGPRRSLAGQFGAWLYQQVIDEFTGDAWKGRPLEHRAVLMMRLSDLPRQCTSEPALHPWCAAYTSESCPMIAGRLDHYRSSLPRDTIRIYTNQVQVLTLRNAELEDQLHQCARHDLGVVRGGPCTVPCTRDDLV